LSLSFCGFNLKVIVICTFVVPLLQIENSAYKISEYVINWLKNFLRMFRIVWSQFPYYVFVPAKESIREYRFFQHSVQPRQVKSFIDYNCWPVWDCWVLRGGMIFMRYIRLSLLIIKCTVPESSFIFDVPVNWQPVQLKQRSSNSILRTCIFLFIKLINVGVFAQLMYC